jgi:hypothetical protein
MSDSTTLQLPPVPPELPQPELPPPEERPRRRRLRAALIAAVAVLLVAAPLTLYLMLRDDSPSITPAPEPSTGPTSSVSVEPSTTAPTATPAPDGRFSLEQLRNATFTVPAWPADNLTGLSGRLTFHDGQVLVPADNRFPFERHIIIGGVTYGDVDHDGASETIVELACVVQGGSQQLVALDRDAAGRIVTMGTVVATTGEIRVIDNNSVRVTSDGVVEARVGDIQLCCGDETPQKWQVRGYGWTGTQFRQVSGPTALPLNPSVTDTSVTAGDLVFGPPADRIRRGTLTVTVRHVRGTRPHHLVLQLWPAPGIERDGTAWPPVRTDGPNAPIAVDLPTPVTGGSASYTFAFRRPVTASGGEFTVQVNGARADGTLLSESNGWDMPVQVTVRTTD